LVERLPVPRHLARAPIDDEVFGLLRVLEVVLEHPEDRLLAPALAPQGRAAGGLDALHPRPKEGAGRVKALSIRGGSRPRRGPRGPPCPPPRGSPRAVPPPARGGRCREGPRG